MSTPGSPNPDLGDAAIPPYDKDDSGSVQDSPISKSSGKGGPETSTDTYGSSTGNPGRIVSDEEKGGVGDTDMDPKGALGGIGTSINASGEEQGGGIGQSGQDSGQEGTKGASGRPKGTTGDETSGVSESADDGGMGQGQGG